LEPGAFTRPISLYTDNECPAAVGLMIGFIVQTLLYQQSNVEIHWDQTNQWLCVGWHGFQSSSDIRRDCEQVLRMMVSKNCDSVLNDNTDADASWTGELDWLANDWFPRMRGSGLRHLAWVHSPARVSEVSITPAIGAAGPGVAKVFSDTADAAQWLRVQRHRAKAITQRIVLPPGLSGR
jgi:hypothetical protein